LKTRNITEYASDNGELRDPVRRPRDAHGTEGGTLQRAVLALGAAGLALVLGLWLGFPTQITGLWHLWTTDPLRSIGMAIPVASLVLMVRVWRLNDWAHGGSWWGLVPVTLAFVFVIITARSGAYVFISTHSSTSLNVMPVGVLLYTYVSGVVWLLGGGRAWRRAWFPLGLLLLVNPIPHAFDTLVDLPLQHLGAYAARSFAALLGVQVTGTALQIMFTPRLGMFIAPGCDGLRGGVAMGLIALVVGYLYRLSWRRWALYVAAAVVLAYLFNLLRLIVLVAYYWVAMRIPVLAGHATLADYLIGGVLFFCAALFLFALPRYWRRRATCSPDSAS